jgi:cobalt-zinc-cadmium resistance protein CzcA
MIERIIRFSVENKTITGVLLAIFLGWGIWSVSRLSVDALPDATNNQVQVITTTPNLATQEVEQFITFPLELQFKNLPDLVQLRSVSRSGLSVVTIVFQDQVSTALARQLVAERLKTAEGVIPAEFGTPEMLPPTTGLGEIYQYTLTVDSAHRDAYDAMRLRTIQDWIVRRQLLGVPGVVEVSSFGGKLKQYEVAVDPVKLLSMDLTLMDVYNALAENNANTGGSYIEKGPNLYYVRGEGLITSLDDIARLAIRTRGGVPIRIKDVAEVRFGFAPRFGAMMCNGQGETVGGIALMIKGGNAMQVIQGVQERIAQIGTMLPEGVSIDVFVDRSKLIARTTATVEENLGLGALIVVLVLVLVLGNLRAGVIVASLIPLSLLFAIGMMNLFGQTANLMSMGALDFGLIVDGAVIIVEGALFLLHGRFAGQLLDQCTMNGEVVRSSSRLMRSAVFGQIIILIVYVPIFALTGVEGKMFRPMAFTVSFAIIGALLLSLTWVPFISSLVLAKRVKAHAGFSDRLVARLQAAYTPLLRKALHAPKAVVGTALLLLLGAGLLFNSLGGEFIPELDEGDFAANYTIRQGSSLEQTKKVGTQLEQILLDSFPEVKEVVSKIGTSEVPSDPMPIESADLIIVLKDKNEWTSAKSSAQLAEKMEQALSVVPGVNLSFEQPIQMRFNELIAGVKSDIAIKLFGEDLDLLYQKGNEIAGLIADVPGLTGLKVEQVVGMPQLVVTYRRDRLAQYGLTVAQANRVLTTALAGGRAGTVYEGERHFDLVVRMAGYRGADMDMVKDLRVPLPSGEQVPMSELADVTFRSAPAQVTREDGERRIVVEANVRGRDIQSAAHDIQARLDAKLQLPPGYFITYGGTFQNLQDAKARLGVAVPISLLLIFFLLFLAFNSTRKALLIFSAVPLAAIGGIIALWLRGMPFSISAGVGFIALFGVAVLNGIVLISYFEEDERRGGTDVMQRILKGARERLRPVMATALVASLGFLPMAISESAGSEVQRPLATVVIGGLISSTLLTLFVLPVLYKLFGSRRRKGNGPTQVIAALLLLCAAPALRAQAPLTLEQAVQQALKEHPDMLAAQAAVDREEALRATTFTLDPLDLQYQFGQLNSTIMDHNISAATGLAAPNVIIRRGQAQRQRIALAESRSALTAAQLRRETAMAFVELQAARERQRVTSALDSLYGHFAAIAKRKVDLGESPPLEQLSAQAEWERVKLGKQSADAEVRAAEAVLRQFTGMEVIGPLAPLAPLAAPLTDSTLAALTPEVQAMAEQASLREAEAKLARAQWTPSLKFGAFNQSLDGQSPFWGGLVGLSIPLVKTGQGGTAKAAALDAVIAQDEQLAAGRQARARMAAALQEYGQRLREHAFYAGEGSRLSDALLINAERNYAEGQIDRTEYIQTLHQASELRQNRIDALLALDRSIIQLNYLNGR